MNHHTQLQFNLGIPPSTKNLATHFDPSHPAPVVIEKPAFVSDDGFHLVSAKKLALAVRLARRDLRMGFYQPASPHLCASCKTTQDKDTTLQSNTHCDGDNPHMATPQMPTHTTSHTELEQIERDTERPLPRKICSSEQPMPVPVRSELSLLGREGNQRIDDRGSKEVVRLRKELQRQVAYMKQLRDLGRGSVVLTRRDAVGRKGRERERGGGGRVWMEEVKGEEEKMLQRREEKMVRDTRTIYNLSLQVSSLQQGLQKLKLTDTPGNVKKVWFVAGHSIPSIPKACRPNKPSVQNSL